MRRKRILVVVCVVLVLGCAGWLIPALGRVREAAARSKCQGNLKYLAVALHGYADTNGSFSATSPLPGVPPERRLSWVVGLLPHMDQGTVFKRFAFHLPADAESNRDAAGPSFAMLVCPSGGPSRWNEQGHYHESDAPVLHYVGVAGLGPDAAELAKGSRVGAFGYDRRMSIPGSFPDGLSSTLLFAETAHDPGHWATGGPATVRPVVPDAAPHIGPGRPFGGFHAAELKLFWSSGAGMNAATADGSIRFVRDSIDPAVLEALATAAGNDLLPKDWWREASQAP